MADKIGIAAPPGFDVKLRFAPRIIAEHLGRQKYATSTKAIGELVANAFDANARTVRVELNEDGFGLPMSLVVIDDGSGMTAFDLRERFAVIGVTADGSKDRLGRFGVGRLAVFRIGSISEWSTTSKDPITGKRQILKFTLRAGSPEEFRVEVTPASDAEPMGTRVEVFDLLDTGSERLTHERISWDLMTEFCSYLFAHRNLRIALNGQNLDPESIIQQRETEEITKDTSHLPEDATVHHILLKSTPSTSRLPANLLLTAKGVTVETTRLQDPPTPNYLGIVESPYLDEMVSSNRQAFINMDGVFGELKRVILERVSAYGTRVRAAEAQRFIERARQKEYYPYRTAPSNALTAAEQSLYDEVLELLNVAANIEGMATKQQQLVFQLVHRALGDENLLNVLGQLATLSSEEMSQFRELLERTTLQSIIRLASAVTERLTFLDVIRQIVYGADAKHVLERSQLHKVLEGNCWIFGPQFNLATSDRGFREVIRRHREIAKLPPVDDAVLSKIKGIANIPDLFLAAQKDYPTPAPERSHYHVLVELKRPSVDIGQKELAQLSKYGDVIAGSGQFDQERTQWDLFLVSSKVKPEIERHRRQSGRAFGCVLQNPGLNQWVFTWGEIIDRAREEMQLVRQHLELKSQEFSVSDHLQHRLSQIIKTAKTAD
jgi:histidine kinase/DNA gyrase B/HSP90-like ATPase